MAKTNKLHKLWRTIAKWECLYKSNFGAITLRVILVGYWYYTND